MKETGYRFEVFWGSTSLREIVNARRYTDAEARVKRKYKTAWAYHFRGECVPWPKAPKNKMPRKVF